MLIGFLSKLLIFLRKNEQMSDLPARSFLVSNLSDSLMVALFLVSDLRDSLTSLIFVEQPERLVHIAHLKKRENERISCLKKTYKKRTKKYNFSQFVLSVSLVFCE